MYRLRLAKACFIIGMTILAIFITLIPEKQAHAWSCSSITVAEKLEKAEYVFKGKVVVDYGEMKQGYPGLYSEYTFDVFKSWKGVDDKQFTLWSPRNLKMHETYLVYAGTNIFGEIITGFCNGHSTGRMMVIEIGLLGELLESVIIQEEIPEPRFVWSDQQIYTKISTVFVAIFFAIWITLRIRKMMTKTKE